MCGERRLTVCRICQTAGNNFPRAYAGPRTADDDDEGRRITVVCPTCDEPFVARFYKMCANCGYEFEDGINVPQPIAGRIDSDHTDTFRLWLVLGGMLVFFVAAGAYLWWLMERPS
jgi:hypothetical protein